MEKRLHLCVSRKDPALWRKPVFGGRPLLFAMSCIGVLFFCGSYTALPWHFFSL